MHMASIQGVAVSPQALVVTSGDSGVLGDLSSSIPDFGTLNSDQKMVVAATMTADNITARHDDIMQQCASQAADLYRSAVVSVLSAEDVKIQMEGRVGGQTARIIVVDFTMPQEMQKVRGHYDEPTEAGMKHVCPCACGCECVGVCVCLCGFVCVRVCLCLCVHSMCARVYVCVCICVHHDLVAIGSAEVGRNLRENGARNSCAGDSCSPKRPFDAQRFQ